MEAAEVKEITSESLTQQMGSLTEIVNINLTNANPIFRYERP